MIAGGISLLILSKKSAYKNIKQVRSALSGNGPVSKVKEQSLKDTLLLLSQNGMLIKRPFLLGDSFGLVGFKEDAGAIYFF